MTSTACLVPGKHILQVRGTISLGFSPRTEISILETHLAGVCVYKKTAAHTKQLTSVHTNSLHKIGFESDKVGVRKSCLLKPQEADGLPHHVLTDDCMRACLSK